MKMAFSVFSFVFTLVFLGYVLMPQSPCDRINRLSMLIDWPGDVVRATMSNLGADRDLQLQAMLQQHHLRIGMVRWSGQLFYGAAFNNQCVRVVTP